VEREFVEVGEGVGFEAVFQVFGLVGFVETEVEVGCFGRGSSLGRTCGVGVERVQLCVGRFGLKVDHGDVSMGVAGFEDR